MSSWNYGVFWDEVMNQIREELGEHEFALWFNIEYDSATENRINIRVPSSFYRDQLVRLYQKLIERKLYELTGMPLSIDFVIVKPSGTQTAALRPQALPEAEEAPTPPSPGGDQAATAASVEEERGERQASGARLVSAEAPAQAKNRGKHPNLRLDYTFENFVIGENNSFAANAALAISKNPGTSYNPFLIYGGVGLGKTHLMQSIGNRVWQTDAKAKVICITAEEFTNEFIQSIHDKTTTAFKNKYRYVDILLIDDIHFLQNKLGSQEELFHTFNALYDANKQMVFTCDRPVSELKNLSDRLRSRFERGLNVDLQPPNFETRAAILKKKVEAGSVPVPDEVVEIISKNISTNVRDLEAALTKLVAYAELVRKDITLEIAQHQLKDVFSQSKHGNVTIDNILRVVADYYKLSYSDLKGKKRTKNIAFPRQVAMYIAREITEYSTTELGFEFGGRDHTTVMHACQKIEERLKLDPNLESNIQSLTRSIKEYSSKV
ncbi:MAG: chromosomal replication initiator protein DnaA [Spirochaetaceae bacterium]|nr:chromosomal replication initiator protein DnaA [Spirochaetaceae bacterium]